MNTSRVSRGPSLVGRRNEDVVITRHEAVPARAVEMVIAVLVGTFGCPDLHGIESLHRTDRDEVLSERARRHATPQRTQDTRTERSTDHGHSERRTARRACSMPLRATPTWRARYGVTSRRLARWQQRSRFRDVTNEIGGCKEGHEGPTREL